MSSRGTHTQLHTLTIKATSVLKDSVDIIPHAELHEAAGVVVLDMLKVGFGFSGQAANGILVARIDELHWSPPVAVFLIGAGAGLLVVGFYVPPPTPPARLAAAHSTANHNHARTRNANPQGAMKTRCVILLDKKSDVRLFSSSLQMKLGVDGGAVVGKGREFASDVGVGSRGAGVSFYYARSRGAYLGVSLDGSMMFANHHFNKKFYGMAVDVADRARRQGRGARHLEWRC